MKVEIEQTSGFCFGVENAVRIAGEALENGERVYCLGEIVHNEIEVERLRSLGLITIDYNEFEKLSDCKVLIRAHGEPPSTYERARINNITLIDATCPIVHTLQERIKRAWMNAKKENGQIVIYGKKGHAEVIGLLGQIDGDAILISDEEDLVKIDFSRPVHLFSQTTKSRENYEHLAEMIRVAQEAISPSSVNKPYLKVYNTICGQVSGRIPTLREFSGRHNIIIFVSGKGSSNGRMLFSICRMENQRSHFISSPDEIRKEWFRENDTVGVCGATSTPKWLIHEVASTVEKIWHKQG
jgi:4-hydroxy-3-methylbut-2-en-1-yl diphosphate reductase